MRLPRLVFGVRGCCRENGGTPRLAVCNGSSHESVRRRIFRLGLRVRWLARWVVAVAQTERALLIGINTYQPAGTTPDHPAGCIYGRCELGTFENLDGSVNDAQAMADLLTSPKFGFPATNVVLLTNPAPPIRVRVWSSFQPIRPRTMAFLPPCRNI